MTQHDKQTILVKILQELWNTWMVHYFEERRYYIVYNPYRALQLEAKKTTMDFKPLKQIIFIWGKKSV